jgi:hypothetical protein
MEAIPTGNKDLDLLILAHKLTSRIMARTGSNSMLLELVELFLSRPLVTAPLGARFLKGTPKAVDLMLAHLSAARHHASLPSAPATEPRVSSNASRPHR